MRFLGEDSMEIMSKKRASAVSVIGGADGPTSVFILGKKEKNLFRRIKHAICNRKYRRKRKIAERSVVPGTHTMQETIRYAGKRYGMTEADASYPYYEERKRNLKGALISREKPELLSEEKRLLPPQDFNDKKAWQRWEKQVREWTEARDREIDAVSSEAFPLDYHLFVADRREQGRLEMEVELLHGVLAISYSGGEKKSMDAMVKDIYCYYGVSQEDIERRTERYKELLAALSM